MHPMFKTHLLNPEGVQRRPALRCADEDESRDRLLFREEEHRHIAAVPTHPGVAMNKLLTFIHLDDPASLKRAIAVVLTGATVVLRPTLEQHGIPMPDDEMMMGLAGLVAAYILQSGGRSIVEAHAAGKVAAAKIENQAQAQIVLRDQLAAQAAEDGASAKP